MAAPRFRAIIFDIGQVLVRLDVSAAMAGLAEHAPLAPQEVWSAIREHPRWQDWQEGRLSPRDWHRLLSERLSVGLSFDQFCEVWNRALCPEPLLREQLLADLSKSCQLAVISNTDPLHVAHLEANFPLLRHFPHRNYSCVVGACKPQAFIYSEALRKCGVSAPEALYIDDVPAYAEAARSLGMPAIVFESPLQLESALAALNLPF